MPKYKCIGGFLDGQFIELATPEAATLQQQFEEPLSSKTAFDVVSDVVRMRVTRTWYTRRSLHSEGHTVYYYSPEHWTDYQTILHMLS